MLQFNKRTNLKTIQKLINNNLEQQKKSKNKGGTLNIKQLGHIALEEGPAVLSSIMHNICEYHLNFTEAKKRKTDRHSVL